VPDPTCDLPDNVPDELVPDPQVAREFNVTLMTLWRWDRDPKLAELGLRASSTSA
jgi:hypothetical protein